jgi:hypothetical protein
MTSSARWLTVGRGAMHFVGSSAPVFAAFQHQPLST